MAKSEIIKNDAVTVRVNAEPVKKVAKAAEKTAEAILEETSDVIEQTLDILEDQVDRVETIVKNNPYVIAGVAVIALSTGAFLGYRYGVKKTTLVYEELMAEEIDKARTFYMRLSKQEEFETPEKAAEALQRQRPSVVEEKAADAMTDYKNGPRKGTIVIESEVFEVEETSEVQRTNVFDQPAPETWSYEYELPRRDVSKPYIIHKDEFFENSTEYEQGNLSYFTEDDVLADERDQVVQDPDKIVGDKNLQMFGHGSGDKNILYVRNEPLSMEWEIVRSNNSFAESVLGLLPEKELRHSESRRAFRRGAGE